MCQTKYAFLNAVKEGSLESRVHNMILVSKKQMEKRYFAEKQKEWRKKNPDRAREIQKRYYEAHRVQRIEAALRRYRAKSEVHDSVREQGLLVICGVHDQALLA